MRDPIAHVVRLKGLSKRYQQLLKEAGLSPEEAYERRTSDLSLQEFVPAISPHFKAPKHLSPLTEVFERLETQPVQVCVSTPPQHAKPIGKQSQVLMADGSFKAIKDVEVGDRVVSGKGRITSVTGKYDQGVLPVLRINARSGRFIVAEKTHRFLTHRGWKRVEELLPYHKDRPRGDYMQVATRSTTKQVARPRQSEADKYSVDGNIPDQVVSVEDAGLEHCYCITVADDESFVANGFITHNTETLKHGIVWLLDRNPSMKVAYVSYVQSFADKQSASLRRYAQSAGLPIDKKVDARRYFLTEQGGHFVATSIGGELTGLGFDLIIIDDPFKDRVQAESGLVRDKVYDWFTSVALTRLAPGGSVIAVHTRWHADDLIGRLTDREDDHWEYIKLPAIDDYGEPLWPERYSLQQLEKRRNKLGEYDWWSLYQGEPRPKGGALFREPARYEHPDLSNSRIIIAVDPAASEKTHADYSAAVVLAVKGYEDNMTADVLEVIRVQKEVPAFCLDLQDLQKKYGAALHIEAIGVGRAVPQILKAIAPTLNIVEITQTKGDKFTRAQPVASAWNTGRVRVPVSAPWLSDFLNEVQIFTGVHDRNDDQVDALSYAWNVASQTVMAGMDYSPIHEPDERNEYDVIMQAYLEKRLESL